MLLFELFTPFDERIFASMSDGTRV